MTDSAVTIRLLISLAIAFGLNASAIAAPGFDRRAAAIRSEIMVDPAKALVDAEKLRAEPHEGSVRVHEIATADWLRAEALLGPKPLRFRSTGN